VAIRAEALQEHGNGRRDDADDEHPLPAEARHDDRTGDGAGRKAQGKDDLIGDERAAAPLGTQNLADIGGGDRDLAAEADALDEAEPEQLVVIRGKGTSEAHQAIKRDGQPRRRHPPNPLRQPAEEQSADRLTEIGDADQPADALRRDMSIPHQHRQHIGNGQRIKAVEKDRDAEDDCDGDMPARKGQPLQPRGYRLL
jgi:hypothetical protein